jgi:hypothetical protein
VASPAPGAAQARQHLLCAISGSAAPSDVGRIGSIPFPAKTTAPPVRRQLKVAETLQRSLLTHPARTYLVGLQKVRERPSPPTIREVTGQRSPRKPRLQRQMVPGSIDARAQ